MKKFTAILLAITTALSFGLFTSACKSKDDSDKDNKKSERKKDEDDPDETEKIDESTENSPTETMDPSKKPSQGSQDAYETALVYIDMMGFSRQGLIDQLTSEWGDGFSLEEATIAVDALENNGAVDWNEQAVKAAIDYAEKMNYSEATILEELESDYSGKFTHEQAAYAIEHINENNLVDWDEIAFEYAETSIISMAYSKNGLITQLEDSYGGNFTHEQAVAAVDRLEQETDIDWNEQALLAAESYLKYLDMDEDELLDQLTSDFGDQFTKEQAEYAISKLH